MKDIKIFTTRYCGFCHQAKALLQRLNMPFEEVQLDGQPELRQKLSEENNGYRTVPMIFIEGRFIGGYTELVQLHRSGKL